MIRTNLSDQDIVNNMLELVIYLSKCEDDANAINITINKYGKTLHMHFESYTDEVR